MKPYYQDAAVTLYLGNMLEVLPELTLRVDAVITDAPYGISDDPLKQKKQSATSSRPSASNNTWHTESEWDRAFEAAWCGEASRCAPIVAWFGHWKMREIVVAAMGHQLRAEIIWAKDMHTTPAQPVASRDERIWLFSDVAFKGQHFETSVWDEPVIPTWAHKDHKNQKPIGLMRRLVRFLTAPGQTILDPFAGSGTTLRAAKDLGRKAIGIEMKEEHCEAVARRMSQEVLPFAVGGEL